MESLVQDVRFAARSLTNSRGFAITTILTTALAIAVNTAMFTIVHATLLVPLPYSNPERLTYIWKELVGAGYPRAPLAPPELVDLRQTASGYEQIGAAFAVNGTLVEEGRPQAVRLTLVTPNFLSMLGVAPTRGRWFNEDDGRVEAPRSIMISGELWRGRFNSGDVIGRRIRIDGGGGALPSGPYTIIGVMPVGFEMLLPPESRIPRAVDGWIPFQYDFSTAPAGISFLSTVGRLAEGAPFADAQNQLESIGRSPKYASPARRFYAVPLNADLTREARPALILLQAAVGLVLLVAVANIAALQLVRANVRRREAGLRAALGASPGRLARLLLTEGVLLAIAGGALGVALAAAAVRLLPLLDVSALPRGADLSINWSVLAFSAAAVIASGLIFGIVPLIEWRGSGRLVITAAGPGSVASRPHIRRVLVIAQIAMSVVLLTGAGLLARTFVKIRAIDPGYRAADVLTFQLVLPLVRYRGQDAVTRFVRQLEQAMQATPGVEAVGIVNQVPLDSSVPNSSTAYWTRATADKADAPIIDARLVTPGYFDALQVKVIAGRAFEAADDETRPLVAIVDESLARRAWPDQNPIGEEIGVRLASPTGFQLRWGRVVGVVPHLRQHRITADVREEVFIPFTQAARSQLSVVLRTRLDADAAVRNVATQIQTIDADLAPARVQRLDRLVDQAHAPARLNMMLAMLFSALSLLMTCVGLYGVVSYSVSQRKSELGVRAALGATDRDLVRLVLRQGVTLTALGVVFGLIGSISVANWLSTLLYGVTRFDPAVYLTVPIVLALVALIASYAPARRVVGMDPKMALRVD